MLADTIVTAGERISVGPDGLAAYLRDMVRKVDALPSDVLFTRRFQVAGQPIVGRFSDQKRADLYASRLPVADTESARPADALRVDVIETANLRWPAPARWNAPFSDPNDFDRNLTTAGLSVVPPHRPRSWEFMDRTNNRAMHITATERDLPPWDGGAPLRMPIHWASLDQGRRIVHGATLGDENTGVLLAGPGGAGKSGTTLAGIAHGLQTVGDDYVVMEPGDPPVAWQAYRLLKQDMAGIARIPGLSARLADRQPNWQGKIEFDPEALFPGCIMVRQPIRALMVPQRGESRVTRIEPLKNRTAFDMLARSTLAQFPTDRASGFLFCARLARNLPSFTLMLSPHPEEIAATLKRFIEGLRT